MNVTDGLDGLASGASIFAIGAYILIGFWQSNQSCFNDNLNPSVAYRCYDVRDPLDLAIVAAAIVGSLIGFLWWNTSPAQIFMGDTGSLGLGGALAALAILSRTELLLAPDRRPVPHRDRLGDRATGLLQAQRRQTHLPDESASITTSS